MASRSWIEKGLYVLIVILYSSNNQPDCINLTWSAVEQLLLFDYRLYISHPKIMYSSNYVSSIRSSTEYALI